jgi:hypothetical protein
MKFISPYRQGLAVCIISKLYIPQVLLGQSDVNFLTYTNTNLGFTIEFSSD